MTENEKQTEVVDIRDIIPDDYNFNKGTDKGREMIEKSFRELGAGRSILLDKNNRIIAGNKSQQAAIAMSIMQQALKGDIAAVSFIRNFLRQTDPQEAEQRKREAADKLAATTQTLRAELERDNLWTGQVVELEQLAQDHCVIDRLNQQMQADDYQDILTEMKKDGTMTVRTHPLLDIRNKLQKQWQADWQAHRQEAFRRIQMKRMQQKQN